MPRYFFHLLDADAAHLVRDLAGVGLRNIGEAEREAKGLAQDIIRHRLHGSGWQVVVTDAHANVVLKVPFAKVRQRKIKGIFDLVRRAMLYEPRVRPYIFTWLLAAVVLGLTLESILLICLSRHAGDLAPI